MSAETLICNLTQDEKRYALELLWATLRGDGQGYTPPEWHAEVLAERMRNPSSEPSKPLGEAMEDIRRIVHDPYRPRGNKRRGNRRIRKWRLSRTRFGANVACKP
jgi:hypothetical protein